MGLGKTLVATALSLTLLCAQPGMAAGQTTVRLSASVSKAVVRVGADYLLSGVVTKPKKGLLVTRHRLFNGQWKLVGSTKTNSKGQWKMPLTAPSTATTIQFRISVPQLKSVKSVWKRVAVIPPASISIKGASDLEHPVSISTTMFGTFANVGEKVSVTVERKNADSWIAVDGLLTYGTTSWAARFTVPEVAGTYQYRATARGSLGGVKSKELAIKVVAAPTKTIDRFGPGSPAGIWGMDVSRWNHMAGDTNGDGATNTLDDGKAINFAKAYANGMRFVYIKGTDGSVHPSTGSTTGQNWANKYAIADRTAAQAAGMYTGFYHYIGMVETNNAAALIADARNEAILAAARVAEAGGYNDLDLPYALDVEHDDLAGSGVADVTTDENIFLWIKTWLLEMEARTGRVPVIYSGPAAMSSEFVPSAFWKKYQIWVAHPTCRRYLSDPGQLCTEELINSGAQPGLKANGFYATPWTVAGQLQWDFWQYRASTLYTKANGILNGSALDVNVYGGTDQEFLAMTSTPWTPFEGDYQKTNSEVQISVTYEPVEPGAPLRLQVAVSRAANGAPAVSGNLLLTQNSLAIAESKIEVTGIGTWRVTLPGRELGFVWTDLSFDFRDTFGFYQNQVLLQTVYPEGQ